MTADRCSRCQRLTTDVPREELLKWASSDPADGPIRIFCPGCWTQEEKERLLREDES
jgi:hypothetical protein